MNLDTACYSSLQAVQLGVKSLRSGEVDLVIADASNLNCSPESFFTSLIVDAVSPDDADGYAKSK
jgi:acyl transferase domain-containing protein